MVDPDIDFHGFDNKKNDDGNLIEDSVFEEYIPIQKNQKLFKFILYTTKVEMKFNSLINLINNTTLSEIGMWIFGFLLFCAVPKDMYLIWILIVHLGKGILGIILLRNIPRTYEIIEGVAKNPNFDEDKIIEMIQAQIKETFIKKWTEKKKYFFLYLVFTIICVVIDFIILIVQLAVFKSNSWNLMNTCMIFVILVFIISDVVYFLWFFTLEFSLPAEIIDPIKKALFGTVTDLKALVFSKFRGQGSDSVIN